MRSAIKAIMVAAVLVGFAQPAVAAVNPAPTPSTSVSATPTGGPATTAAPTGPAGRASVAPSDPATTAPGVSPTPTDEATAPSAPKTLAPKSRGTAPQGTAEAKAQDPVAVLLTNPQIAAFYKSSAVDVAKLGKPVGKPVGNLPDDGVKQDFERGEVAVSEKTTPAAIVSGINSRWNSLGSEKGTLAYPTQQQEQCGLKNGGCAQSFQGGSIHWTQATGAQATGGGIQNRWKALGWENGELGYPQSGERCGYKSAGCAQTFQGGQIHWTQATGAHATSGDIQNRWASLSWQDGKLGYPTTDEKCGLAAGGCYQSFQGGQIHYTAATGAQTTWGAIASRWAAMGYESGSLRYPTTGERCGLKGGGCYQSFQGGQIHYTSATGAWMTTGEIAKFWGTQGYEGGKLGYPKGNENCNSTHKECTQVFQGGTVLWQSGKGTGLQPPAPPKPPAQTTAQKVIAYAKQYVGAPYKYGGTTPSGWDCSGYVAYVFKKAGVTLPRTSSQQADAGKVVSKASAKPGDLVYRPGHIGIYAGNGMMYDAGSVSSGTSYRSFAWMGTVTYIRVL